MAPPFLLRSLPVLPRLALTGLVVTILIGMAASAQHLVWHYERRDDRPGLTRDDVTSAYHGLDAPSELLTALRRGHPEELDAELRTLLINWVQSGRINEDYDNIDLGVASPREAIAANCLGCHAPASASTPTSHPPRLDSLDELRKVAFGRKVQPNSEKIVMMSLHTHALSLGTLSLVLAGLLWCTRLPQGLAGGLLAVHGLALPADLAAWWLARKQEGFVHLIIAAGGVYNATVVLIALLIVLDLWWPRRRIAG